LVCRERLAVVHLRRGQREDQGAVACGDVVVVILVALDDGNYATVRAHVDEVSLAVVVTNDVLGTSNRNGGTKALDRAIIRARAYEGLELERGAVQVQGIDHVRLEVRDIKHIVLAIVEEALDELEASIYHLDRLSRVRQTGFIDGGASGIVVRFSSSDFGPFYGGWT